MPNLDEPYLVLPYAQRLHDSVNAISGQTKNNRHSPFNQRINQ
jgi:hypothetical protein